MYNTWRVDNSSYMNISVQESIKYYTIAAYHIFSRSVVPDLNVKKKILKNKTSRSYPSKRYDLIVHHESGSE
jgi:hypothetical protein